MDRSEGPEESSGQTTQQVATPITPQEPLFVEMKVTATAAETTALSPLERQSTTEGTTTMSSLEAHYLDRWRNFEAPILPWWYRLWKSETAMSCYTVFVYLLHFITIFEPALLVAFADDASGLSFGLTFWLAGATFLLMIFAAAFHFSDHWKSLSCGSRFLLVITFPIWVWGAVVLRQWHHEEQHGRFAPFFSGAASLAKAETVESWVRRTLAARPAAIEAEELSKGKGGNSGDGTLDTEDGAALTVPVAGPAVSPAEAKGIDADAPLLSDHPILHSRFLSIVPYVDLAAGGKRYQFLGFHGVIFSFFIALFWSFLSEDSGPGLSVISLCLFIVNFLVHQSPVSTWDTATLAHRLARHGAAAVDVLSFLYLMNAIYWGPVIDSQFPDQNNIHLFGGRLQIILPIGIWFVFFMAKGLLVICGMLSVIGQDQAFEYFCMLFQLMIYCLEVPKLSWMWAVLSLKNRKISDSLLINFILGNDSGDAARPSFSRGIFGERKRRLLLVIALTSSVVDPSLTGIEPDECEAHLGEREEKRKKEEELRRRSANPSHPESKGPRSDETTESGRQQEDRSGDDTDAKESPQENAESLEDILRVPDISLGVPQPPFQRLRMHQLSHEKAVSTNVVEEEVTLPPPPMVFTSTTAGGVWSDSFGQEWSY